MLISVTFMQVLSNRITEIADLLLQEEQKNGCISELNDISQIK